MSRHLERSFIMIKPDGVQRRLIGQIVSRFENRGYKLVALKMKRAPLNLLQEHYRDLSEKPFYNNLCQYMASGPLVCMVWEGTNVVSTGRDMLGATDPLKSQPGTIRGDYAIDVGRNVCHGSDSVDSAKREISLWFEKNELLEWKSMDQSWIYESS